MNVTGKKLLLPLSLAQAEHKKVPTQLRVCLDMGVLVQLLCY